MFSAIKNYIVEKVVTRLLQPSSIVGYAAAIFAYLNWQPDATGVQLLQQVLNAILAFVLFVVNEKPWIKAK